MSVLYDNVKKKPTHTTSKMTKSTHCVFLIRKFSNIRKGDFLVDICKPIRFSRTYYISKKKKNKRFFFVYDT